MKPVLFLRIASVLTLIHAVLHTIGGVFSKPEPGLGAAAYAVMKANEFAVFGLTRSYFAFYRGLGLCVTIFLTAEAIAFWQLGTLAKTDAVCLRPIVATFLFAYLALAVNSYTYFFFGPVITEILIVLCLGMAIMTAKSVELARAGQVAANRV
jgi:hypothetical protein